MQHQLHQQHQHVCRSLSKAEGTELGTANSTKYSTQHKNAAPFLQLREPSKNFCSPYSSVLALIAASHSSLLLPSFCLCVCLPSITYLLHHHLLSSTVQDFGGSCLNPKTGCSYSSAASSPERKKFQYFYVCSHPNLGRKTGIRDSLQKFTSSKKTPTNPSTHLRTPVHTVSSEMEYFHITETKIGSFWFGDLT